MLVTGVLGFPSQVLVVCLVLPVTFFVIRRKWRLAVARQVELEAAAEYHFAAVVVAPNQCAFSNLARILVLVYVIDMIISLFFNFP